MGETAASLEGLTIRYGPILAVDGATCAFPRGATGLLGRNGAGKSSILRAMLGLVAPKAGQVVVEGIDARRHPAMLRRRVGYMPERDCYLPLQSGFEMVALAGELTGLPRGHARQRAHEALYLVGLGEERYRQVAEYSTGMRQRVKLATALVHDPPLLVLDEPTSGLDPGGRLELLDLVAELSRVHGKSIILSTHILADVERVCSAAVLLEAGKVVAAGSLEELTRPGEAVVEAVLRGGGGAGVAVGILSGRGVPARALDQERLEARLPAGQGVHALFVAAREAGSSVRSLQRRRRTLEEVFLEAVAAAAPGAVGGAGGER